ncbi:MAG: C25 family cysteine peptidase [candidate division WOR-3 bacterium]
MRKIPVFLIILINLTFALTGAKYLIITPDNYISALQPLAEWKTKKGVKAKIVPLSVTGSSASQIKSYITNAYNTWDIRPEYILLVGTTIPSSNNSDDYYADISGNYRIELSIGRFPASSVEQVQNLVAKTITFERNPNIADSLWLKKGTTIVREDGSSSSDPIYWANARYIHQQWRNHQYIKIDSFSSNLGNSSADVNTAINEGRIFVVYRGQAVSNWWSPFAMSPSGLNNGNKTPIVVSGTCATMSFSNSSYLGNEFVNAGSASNPKGAVAFWGTTSVGSGIAAQRGAATVGFFKAIFEERISCLGDAVRRGKLYLDSIYNNQTRYQEWNLFGDPELNIWTDVPMRLSIDCETIIPCTPQTFTVYVHRGDIALPGALVCLMMDTIIYQTAYSNASGIASFTISPPTTGTMSVTATLHNYIPYEKNILVIPGNLDHDVGVVAIIEPQGTLSINTNVIPKVKVKNYGNYPDSFPVTFKIGTIYEQTIMSPLVFPQDTITVSFQNWTAVAGNYAVLAYTSLNNDQWHSNDSFTTNISVVVANDIGVEAIMSPDSTQPVNISVVPKARIKNYGSLAQTNFAVSCSIFSISGVLRYHNTQIVSALGSNETTTVIFASWLPTIGEQCLVKVRTNLIGDENPINDELTKQIRITMLFVLEGFNGQFPPDGWQNIIVQGNYSWQGLTSNNNPSCYPYEGEAMASYPSYSAGSGSMARLISPPIALGTTPVACSLKFCMYHDQGFPGGGFGPDSVKIEYSTNGVNFNRVAAFRRYEPYNGWTEHAVYLGNLSGTIYLGILAFSEYGNNINIDYVRLFSPSAVEENENPTNITIRQTKLYSPLPNPIVNSKVKITFQLANADFTQLTITDILGRTIKTLYNNYAASGIYQLVWNCQDNHNQKIKPGIYFCSLKTSTAGITRKIVVTK